MAQEKRLIDVDAMVAHFRKTKITEVFPNWRELSNNTQLAIIRLTTKYRAIVLSAPTVDAVPVEQYKALLESYNELRENFVDYVCSGVPNVAPYCLNKCEECVDAWGWCKQTDECKGFNPATVFPDEERRTDNEDNS